MLGTLHQEREVRTSRRLPLEEEEDESIKLALRGTRGYGVLET